MFDWTADDPAVESLIWTRYILRLAFGTEDKIDCQYQLLTVAVCYVKGVT